MDILPQSSRFGTTGSTTFDCEKIVKPNESAKAERTITGKKEWKTVRNHPPSGEERIRRTGSAHFPAALRKKSRPRSEDVAGLHPRGAAEFPCARARKPTKARDSIHIWTRNWNKRHLPPQPSASTEKSLVSRRDSDAHQRQTYCAVNQNLLGSKSKVTEQ